MLKKYLFIFMISLLVLQCELPTPIDILPPVPVLVYPYEGAVISKDIKVRVEASDNKKIKKVWAYLDGEFLGETSSQPYLIDLVITDSEKKDGLSHVIQIAASDENDNIGYSAITRFTIAETDDIIPPSITILNPQPGQTVEDTVKVIALAQDERSISDVEFFVDGVKLSGVTATPNQTDPKSRTYFVMWATSEFEDSTNHTIYAKATDGGNNTSISPVVTVSVFPTKDTTPPAGIITYPLGGQVVFGTVNVTIEATDDAAVSKVELYVDGENIATDTATPFQFSWDTAPYADDGTHSIYAKVYDLSGNNSTTALTTITVSSGTSDDVTAPNVLVLYPITGRTVSGTVAIGADARDNVGVTKVEYFIDGALEGTTTSATNGTWFYNWNSTAKADTNTHTIYLRAYDAAGNIGTSALTTVTVVAP
jgi:Big-like domain-containing protein